VASAVESLPMSFSSSTEIARVGPGRTVVSQLAGIFGCAYLENVLAPGESACHASSSSFRGVPL
jgi:hypothetical protein